MIYVTIFGFFVIGFWGAVVGREFNFIASLFFDILFVLAWVMFMKWVEEGPDYDEPTLSTTV